MDIPFDIYVSVIMNWMDSKDLAFFDTAVCNYEMRKQFTTIIQNKIFYIAGMDSNDLNSLEKIDLFLSWVAVRELKVKKLFLFGCEQMCRCLSFHNSYFDQVTKLELAHVEGNLNHIIEIVKIINNCHKIQHLTLYNIQSFDEVFKYISNKLLRCLLELRINLTCSISLSFHLTGCVANYCSHLVFLNLAENNFVGGSPDVLGQLVRILFANSNLLYIGLNHALLDCTILTAIQINCRLIQRIKLSGSRRVLMSDIMDTAKRCPTLTSFLVDANPEAPLGPTRELIGLFRMLKVSDAFLVQVFQSVNLSASILLRVTELPIIKVSFKGLRLTNEMISSLARNSPLLELLSINNCADLFSVQSMLKITSKCLLLKKLHLGDCVHFTTQDFVTIFSSCYLSLRVMSLSGNNNIQICDVRQVINHCVQLEEVCVSNCALISYNLVHGKYGSFKDSFFHINYNKKMFEDFFKEDEIFLM